MTGETFFIPGPTQVRPEILAAMTRPMIPHRGGEMHGILERVGARLQPLFGTTRPVYVATCAATAMMEAAIRSGARRSVLSLVSGAFGERFARIAESCGREVERIVVPVGETVPASLVAERLATGAFDAVTMVHVETSTGVIADVAAIAQLTQAMPDTMLLVDAVSSVGGVRVEMDAWGADLVLTASQKALALPPGLAFAACSARFLERARTLGDRGVYLDLVRYDEFWHKRETSTTPAISLIYALDAQLDTITRHGLDARFARHARMAETVWRWVSARRERGMTIDLLAAPGVRAPTVSCIRCDDARSVVAAARERGYVLGAGYGDLAATTFRIGHMGDHTVSGIDALLRVLGEVLAQRART
ncbi:MAG TPA: alanine--glyoxylate aminotransferase family protein [Gemmatimonadaceae bacterium]|nr:alanine--glyoxylate aminotransferase family protein [Gemmatimonadaceae bacterium]